MQCDRGMQTLSACPNQPCFGYTGPCLWYRTPDCSVSQRVQHPIRRMVEASGSSGKDETKSESRWQTSTCSTRSSCRTHAFHESHLIDGLTAQQGNHALGSAEAEYTATVQPMAEERSGRNETSKTTQTARGLEAYARDLVAGKSAALRDEVPVGTSHGSEKAPSGR